MAMAILPEEFPVVLTIFLALGAWRISRSRVLTRRMPAIETLGAATVLCVDKTGTLTQNQMTLKKLAIGGRTATIGADVGDLSEEFHALLENAILASKRDPFDPMELALQAAGDRLLMQTEHLHPEWSLLREYPLTPQLLAVSQAWKLGAGEDVVVAGKGAPEAIAELCRLSPERRASVADEAAALAAEGLRVLGVACARMAADSLPGEHSQLALEFVGLVGLEDPLRATVPAAVSECRTAGIRIVMITGDYPATAQSIARQAGLANPEKIITGPELECMSDEELAKQIKQVQVFARVVPEQKLRIVMALKANHEIVAMTGDGVNDAPALKAAHIGIAMGGRGTDVAREAASLVLLDDDFSSIVAAVRLGRRIFDNIKKAIAFIFAVHVPIAGLSMLPVFFSDWPLLLFPVHIVFLELIIDPACSLIFEAEEAEANVMERPPTKRQRTAVLVCHGRMGGTSGTERAGGVPGSVPVFPLQPAARRSPRLGLSHPGGIGAGHYPRQSVVDARDRQYDARAQFRTLVGGRRSCHLPGARASRPGGPGSVSFRPSSRRGHGAQSWGGRSLHDVVRTGQAVKVAKSGP